MLAKLQNVPNLPTRHSSCPQYITPISTHWENSLGQSCKTGNYWWPHHCSQKQCYILSVTCAPFPTQCNVECQKKVRECVFNSAGMWGGVGENRATCTLNLQIFLLRVFKESRVQIYPKVFVNDHRCRCSILLGSQTLQLHIWRQASNSIAFRDVKISILLPLIQRL